MTLAEVARTREAQLIVDWIERNVGGVVTSIESQARWRPMWDVAVERDGTTSRLVVRGERPDVMTFPLAHEMRLQRLMHEHGIAVPRVRGWIDDPVAYVMDRVEDVRPDFNGTDERDRDVVVDEYLQELVRLHAVDVAPFVEAGIEHADRPEGSAQVGMGCMERTYRRLKNRPNPFVEWALSWVRRHPPRSRGRQSVVIWDSGQILHRDGHFVSMIDVELGHVGDPMIDLAGWRQRDTLLHFGDFDRLYDRYAELSGAPVDLEAIQLHHIASTLWNELPFAHTFRDPVDTDYMTNMQWVNETNLFFTEGVAEYLDVELPVVEVPEPRRRQVTGAHRHLVRSLRELEAERVRTGTDDATDDFVHGGRRDVVAYKLRSAFRLARHLERYMEIGDAVERADLDDIEAVTGERPETWLEGEEQLERFVLADAEAGLHEHELLALFHQRLTRAQLLNGPAGSAIARHATLQPFRNR